MKVLCVNENCTNNKSKTCSLDEIKVNNQVRCDSFSYNEKEIFMDDMKKRGRGKNKG
jgi:hypothetical protein